MSTTQLACQKPCKEELCVSVQPCYPSGADGVGGKGPFSQASGCQHSHLSGALAEGKGLHAKTPSALCLQVVLLGIDILSALVSRLQDRFKAQIGTGKGSVCEWGRCHHCSVGVCSDCCTQSLLSPQESTWEALGGFRLCRMAGGLVPPSGGGRAEGLCHCDSFLRDLDVCVFFHQCCQVYLIGWETLRTR